MSDYRRFTKREEIFNTLLHGIGFILANVGFVAIIWRAGSVGGLKNLIGALIYGVSVIILYASSTLYHGLSHTMAKRLFQILDHSSIYLMIGGSFVPLIVVGGVNNLNEYICLITIVFFSILGMISEIFISRTKLISVVIYTCLASFFAILVYPILMSLGPEALWLVIFSGLSFLIGTPFYIFKRFKYFHVIWHLFVLIGTIIYWYFIVFIVLV